MLYAPCPMPKSLDMIGHFCYKTPGSAKLTGGAPGLQIRCGAVRAVPGGFDSHALPPTFSIITTIFNITIEPKTHTRRIQIISFIREKSTAKKTRTDQNGQLFQAPESPSFRGAYNINRL
jgi:hypothetical protein